MNRNQSHHFSAMLETNYMPPVSLCQQIEVDEFIYVQDELISPHCSLWGDFNFSLHGVLEFHVEQQHYLSPPNYGLWLPPQIAHHSVALENLTHYVCIRIHPSLCEKLAPTTQVLSIQPFFRSLVKQILQQQKRTAPAEHLEHLLQVLYDQLHTAPTYAHYLPHSRHPLLQDVLARLAEPEYFHQNLQQRLAPIPVSERHLLRLCQQELNLSLSEWRNRAKMLYAMSQIHQGISIKQLAYDLGYQHSSSFIEFFKRYSGQTPAQMRHNKT